MPEWWA